MSDSLHDEASYVPAGLDAILGATEKLLAVNRGLIPPDERDSLEFKQYMSPAALLGERIALDAGKVRYHLMRRAAKDRSLNSFTPGALNDYASGLIIGNSLTQPLEEINPMQLVEQANSVTGMGPGGIGSEDAITEAAQNVAPSQFGFVSPLEGPECYDDISEVYTESGWLPWREVSETTKFACNVHNALQFLSASRIIKEPYKGVMMGMATQHYRMCITPSHRVVYRLSEEKDVRIAKAADVYASVIELPFWHEQKTHADIALGIAWELQLYVQWQKKAYDGIVYCAEVPGGWLFVRGKKGSRGYWSGNSSRAGIDARRAVGVKVGDDGRLYQRFYDRRIKKHVWLSPEQTASRVVKLPD